MAYHHAISKTLLMWTVQSHNVMFPHHGPSSTICCVSVLPATQLRHPAELAGLLAVCTPNRLVVISIRPTSIEFVFQFVRPRSARLSTLPACLWRHAHTLEETGDHVYSPLLVCSFGRVIVLHEVTVDARQVARQPSTVVRISSLAIWFF